MDSAGTKETVCNLVSAGPLKLEEAYLDRDYTGLVVIGDMIMVADWNACEVLLHRLQDGKLLYSTGRLEARPMGICLLNEMEFCVVLFNCKIAIMSFHCASDTAVIERVRTLDVNSAFEACYAAVKFMDKIVVSGQKRDRTCWCLVSPNDGHVDSCHQICKEGSVSYLTTKDNIIYISCDGYCPESGVYAYDIQNPSEPKFIFKHNDLKWPRGITVDTNGFIFVCNMDDPPCIYHLTDKCVLVKIYMEGLPFELRDIFWYQEHLYVARSGSNIITRYKPVYSDQPVIPPEILRMDEKSKQLFKEALKKGEEKVYNIRVMVVGHSGVGKTTLVKRLLGKEVNIDTTCPTEGIDVHVHCCDVSLKTFKWNVLHMVSEEDDLILRVASVLKAETPKVNVNDETKQETHEEMGPTPEKRVKKIHEHDTSHKSKEQVEVPSIPVEEKQSQLVDNISAIGGQNTDLKEHTLHVLLCEKVHKLPQSMDEYASLSVWDFAGEFAFYATHQTFITRSAIYLLVSDVSQKFDNPVDDNCYRDSSGNSKCDVRELFEVWLNSIHSCALSHEDAIPPVILVGTHVDKINEDHRQSVCESYFQEVRSYLKDKPSRFHLVNEEFAIDNSVVDSKLETLKRKIVEVASKQKYWGEKIPAHWLLLELALMKLRHDGVKIIPRNVAEILAATHQIPTDELELFLRFQHDIGAVLYFGIEMLREKVLLVPKWMIDALKSLINANDMAVMRNNPKVSDKVPEFKNYGILHPDLIDAIWMEEENQGFHDHKEHILQLMEELNIIAKTRSYRDDTLEIKEENYFLVPCALRQETPKEIISPKPGPQMESSSVLCFVFTGKCLPVPIFHRLLAACVDRWPIATKKTERTRANLIFCGCGVFQLDQFHKLTLHFLDFTIFMRVTRMGINNKTPSLKLCVQVRKFVADNLRIIIGYLGQSLKFERFIQCPEYIGNSVNSLILVSSLKENDEVCCELHDHIIESRELLKFWFEDPGTQGPVGKDTGIHNSLLVKLSKDIPPSNWKFFFRALSVEENELEEVESNYRNNVREQIYQLLYHLNHSRRLNKTNIIEAFKGIEKNDLADKYS